MPCRHQARLLPVILPEHVIARHRTKFRAFFKIPGKEDITREWDRIKHEYRLLITEQEKQFCIDNAKLLQSQQMASLPYDFWENFGPSQSSVNGVISEIVASNNDSGPELFFFGLPQPSRKFIAIRPHFCNVNPTVAFGANGPSKFQSLGFYIVSSQESPQHCPNLQRSRGGGHFKKRFGRVPSSDPMNSA